MSWWDSRTARVALCVTQLDPKLVERGVACGVGKDGEWHGAPFVSRDVTEMIVSVQKIRFFKGPIASKAKFHRACASCVLAR